MTNVQILEVSVSMSSPYRSAKEPRARDRFGLVGKSGPVVGHCKKAWQRFGGDQARSSAGLHVRNPQFAVQVCKHIDIDAVSLHPKFVGLKRCQDELPWKSAHLQLFGIVRSSLNH